MVATGSSQANRVRAVLEIDIRELLSVVVAPDKAGVQLGFFITASDRYWTPGYYGAAIC